MASKYFKKALNRSPKYIKRFTKKSFDVIDRVHQVLDAKQLTQRDLAKLLGKEESEISKLLGVGHNITLKTISKIETALDTDILIVPKELDFIFPKGAILNSNIKVEYKKTDLNNSNCQITDREPKSKGSRSKTYKFDKPTNIKGIRKKHEARQKI